MCNYALHHLRLIHPKIKLGKFPFCKAYVSAACNPRVCATLSVLSAEFRDNVTKIRTDMQTSRSEPVEK
jgi:hypothetical protein